MRGILARQRSRTTSDNLPCEPSIQHSGAWGCGIEGACEVVLHRVRGLQNHVGSFLDDVSTFLSSSFAAYALWLAAGVLRVLLKELSVTMSS